MMIANQKKVNNIFRWRNRSRNRKMLQKKYPRQFIACSATRLIAAGTDFRLVVAEAQSTGEEFIIDWVEGMNPIDDLSMTLIVGNIDRDVVS